MLSFMIYLHVPSWVSAVYSLWGKKGAKKERDDLRMNCVLLVTGKLEDLHNMFLSNLTLFYGFWCLAKKKKISSIVENFVINWQNDVNHLTGIRNIIWSTKSLLLVFRDSSTTKCPAH